MNFKSAGIITAALCVITVNAGLAEEAANPAPATHQMHIMIAPEDIVWGDCPPFLPLGAKCTTVEGDPLVPGALFAIRSKLPDNYKIPPHFHSTDEHITVISGTFAMGLGEKFDEKSLRAMSTGSFMVMPKNAPHFAITRGETIVQVHALGPLDFTYINPADDPRKS